MTEKTPSTPEVIEEILDEQPHFKTLGVRLEESKHAQLRFIAQLTNSTIADEIRRAIDGRIEAAQVDPDLIARADAIRAEVEREAEARRTAIAGFFGKQAVERPVSTPASRQSSRGGAARTGRED